jgi:RNA polymerase sigma-70 factor (ECF subfamily)
VANEDQDRDIIQRAINGERGAFDSIVSHYTRRVFQFAWRMTGSSDAAEDIAQECFVALFVATPKFDPARATVSTFLYSVARNLSVSRLRRLRPDQPVDENASSPVPSVEADLLKNETAEMVRHAIERLPEAQREVLLLFEYEELSLKEIGAVLNLEIAAVKSRLFRARESLKLQLAPLRKNP